MSSDVAIRCEGLSKRYRIGKQERYKALRDVITDAAAAPFRRFRSVTQDGNNNPQSDHVWALDDVSFEVKPGEVVGIIGSNGAGKSTLLKILSRITKPTRGHAEIHGSVGSLLEVGTGFHPELTGRENIYLNAAILGMRKLEVERKFDEIVAFAEVEKFIDTPVKRYSSGMQVRLAFAVAAHMETEILLVDEVLAVGDAQFQKKCLGRMGTVGEEGKTVLLVSHNMAAIQSISKRALFLDKGSVLSDGDSSLAIGSYLDHFSADAAALTDLKTHPYRQSGCQPIFSSVRIFNSAGEPTTSVFTGDDLIIDFELLPPSPITEPTLGIGIDNAMGLRVFSVATYFSQFRWPILDRPVRVRCVVPSVSLLPGRYVMSLSVGNNYNYLMDAISQAAFFNVEQKDYFGNGRLPTSDLGVVLSKSHWEFSEI